MYFNAALWTDIQIDSNVGFVSLKENNPDDVITTLHCRNWRTSLTINYFFLTHVRGCKWHIKWPQWSFNVSMVTKTPTKPSGSHLFGKTINSPTFTKHHQFLLQDCFITALMNCYTDRFQLSTTRWHHYPTAWSEQPFKLDWDEIRLWPTPISNLRRETLKGSPDKSEGSWKKTIFLFYKKC